LAPMWGGGHQIIWGISLAGFRGLDPADLRGFRLAISTPVCFHPVNPRCCIILGGSRLEGSPGFRFDGFPGGRPAIPGYPSWGRAGRPAGRGINCLQRGTDLAGFPGFCLEGFWGEPRMVDTPDNLMKRHPRPQTWVPIFYLCLAGVGCLLWAFPSRLFVAGLGYPYFYLIPYLGTCVLPYLTLDTRIFTLLPCW